MARIAADVHPPLYFMILDQWAVLSGESIFAMRLLSAFFGLLAVAAIYTTGKYIIDGWAGLIAATLLGTTSFLVYYTREIRMYTLLLLLSVLCMWAYLAWMRHHTKTRLVFYSLAIAGLGYVHYYGLLIPLTQGIHLLLSQPRQFKHWLGPVALSILFYLPWLPVLGQQMYGNPNGPLALPAPTNTSTILWLLILVTGGAKAWVLLPLVSGKAITKAIVYKNTLSLLLLWTVITPLLVFSLNIFVPLYQPRYVIGILPAVLLLMAFTLRFTAWRPLALLLTGLFIFINLTSYHILWSPKSAWDATSVTEFLATRQPDEPSLTMFVEDYGLAIYYDQQIGLRNKSTRDLSGQRHYSPAEINQLIQPLANEPRLWLIMPSNIGETWLTATALNKYRTIGYRGNAHIVLFYRFDKTQNNEVLQFYFGDTLRFDNPLFVKNTAFSSKERACVDLALTTLKPLNGSYSYGLHLVNQANQLQAQYDTGLGQHPSEAQIQLLPCVDIPSTAESGLYYLHLVVYTWQDGIRLPIFEESPNGIFWGNTLIFETVTVE